MTRQWIFAFLAGAVLVIVVVLNGAEPLASPKSRIEVLGNFEPEQDFESEERPSEVGNLAREPEDFDRDLGCDEDGGFTSSLHSSIKPIRDFTMSLEKNPQELTQAQCLAVMGFAKVQDWWGVECKERDINAISEWMRSCLKEDWASKTSRRMDCQLLHYKDLGEWNSSRKMERYLKENFEECSWSREKIRAMTPELIEQALKEMDGRR